MGSAQRLMRRAVVRSQKASNMRFILAVVIALSASVAQGTTLPSHWGLRAFHPTCAISLFLCWCFRPVWSVWASKLTTSSRSVLKVDCRFCDFETVAKPRDYSWNMLYRFCAYEKQRIQSPTIGDARFWRKLAISCNFDKFRQNFHQANSKYIE